MEAGRPGGGPLPVVGQVGGPRDQCSQAQAEKSLLLTEAPGWGVSLRTERESLHPALTAWPASGP